MSSKSLIPAGFPFGMAILLFQPRQSHIQLLLICGEKKELRVACPSLLILPLPMECIHLTKIFTLGTASPFDLQIQVVSHRIKLFHAIYFLFVLIPLSAIYSFFNVFFLLYLSFPVTFTSHVLFSVFQGSLTNLSSAHLT